MKQLCLCVGVFSFLIFFSACGGSSVNFGSKGATIDDIRGGSEVSGNDQGESETETTEESSQEGSADDSGTTTGGSTGSDSGSTSSGSSTSGSSTGSSSGSSTSGSTTSGSGSASTTGGSSTGGSSSSVDYGTGADNDFDGYKTSVDCDDTDSSIHPGASDVWGWSAVNGTLYEDKNCDGVGTASVAAFGESWAGENTADALGQVIANAGDVNGDGCEDILVGAPGNDDAGADAGKVYLLHGDGPGCLGNLPSDLGSLLSIDTSFVGGNAGDSLGSSVAGLGDLDNDGCDDFALSAPLNSSNGTSSGEVYVFFGRGSSCRLSGSYGSLSSADLVFAGLSAGDMIGLNSKSIAGLGDVNSDGCDDFAITSTLADPVSANEGEVYVIFGSDPGDVNCDDSNYPVNLSQSDYIFEGVTTQEQLGYAVSALGDFNNDGCDDFGISSTAYDSNRGIVYLVEGIGSGCASSFSTLSNYASLIGEEQSDFFGYDISSWDDLNEDGLQDFVVTSPNHNGTGAGSGKVYFVSGASFTGQSSVSSVSSQSYSGLQIGHGLGVSLFAKADVNEDSCNDVIVGAPNVDSSVDNVGAVYVILGKGPSSCSGSFPSDLSAADITLTGIEQSDFWGDFGSITAVDLVGDGRARLMLSSRQSNAGGNNSGVVYLDD